VGALASALWAVWCIPQAGCANGSADSPDATESAGAGMTGTEKQGRTTSADSASDCLIGADDPATFDEDGVVQDDGSILVPDGTNTSDGFTCRGGNWVTTPAELGSCLLDPSDANLVPIDVGVQMNDGTIVVPNGTETFDNFLCADGSWFDESA
jgi:hypothetical protein